MPRRPTSSPSTRNQLRDRLDDAADGDWDTIPVVIFLSASRETCVDAERGIHRVCDSTYRFPPNLHETVMKRETSD